MELRANVGWHGFPHATVFSNHFMINVLFVSRRNTARSFLAQACLNHLGKERYRAYSCGAPGYTGDAPHPVARQALLNTGISSGEFACRDWNAFTRNGAPRMAFVIVLAQDVAEHMPRWPGQPATAVWAYPDITDTVGLAAPADDVYPSVLRMLLSVRQRIELLVSLPMHGVDREALRDDIRDLGHLP